MNEKINLIDILLMKLSKKRNSFSTQLRELLDESEREYNSTYDYLRGEISGLSSAIDILLDERRLVKAGPVFLCG